MKLANLIKQNHTNNFMVSFRLKKISRPDYSDVYENLRKKLKEYDNFNHTTSCYIIKTEEGIFDISSELKKFINPDIDRIIVKNLDVVEATFIGPEKFYKELIRFIKHIEWV